MTEITFPSSKMVHGNDIGSLHVRLYPDKGLCELYTTGGKTCALKGEDLGRFLAWMAEKDYKL